MPAGGLGRDRMTEELGLLVSVQTVLDLGGFADVVRAPGVPSSDWTSSALAWIDAAIPGKTNRKGTARERQVRPVIYLYSRDWTLLEYEVAGVRGRQLAIGEDEPLSRLDGAGEFDHVDGAGANVWSRCSGERVGGQGRETYKAIQAPAWARWRLEARSHAIATGHDVIEATMRAVASASENIRLRLGLTSEFRCDERVVEAPCLEFVVLALAMALAGPGVAEALLLALDLVVVHQPLTDDWIVGLELAMVQGRPGAVRLAELTHSPHGDPVWGALAWAWRMSRPGQASFTEVAIAWGMVGLNGWIDGQDPRLASALAWAGQGDDMPDGIFGAGIYS